VIAHEQTGLVGHILSAQNHWVEQAFDGAIRKLNLQRRGGVHGKGSINMVLQDISVSQGLVVFIEYTHGRCCLYKRWIIASQTQLV
jgi:hypothetical protein